MSCINCYETCSPQWRKINNEVCCNACYCYYKRYKKHKVVEEIYATILMNFK